MEVSFNTPLTGPSMVGNEGIKKTKTVSYSTKVDVQRVDAPQVSEAALDTLETSVRAYRPDPKKFYRGYNGRVNTNWTGPQYVYIKDVAKDILFSQTTISDFNKGKTTDYPLDYLADSMFVEYRKDIDYKNDGVLDIVDNGDGTFTSLDNRRLFIAKKIGEVDRFYGIWIKVHSRTEELASFNKRRFYAETWGEAVDIRVDSEGKMGHKRYPTIMEGMKRKASQSIPVNVTGMILQGILHDDDLKQIRAKRVQGVINI